MKKPIILFIIILVDNFAFSQSNQIAEKSGFAFDFFSPIILPAFIGVGGYILKSIYEFIVERQNRKRKLIEEQLKHFYWPILTRLEHNNATWRVILNKKEQNSELQNSIVNYVESGIIIKNHREIISIILNFRFLAKFDDKLSEVLQEYLRHVVIYEGIIESKQNTLPGFIGAPYPKDFDKIYL